MSALWTLWIASWIGAALFFAAGWLASRRRLASRTAPAVAAAVTAPAPTPAAPGDLAGHRAGELEQRADDAERRAGELERRRELEQRADDAERRAGELERRAGEIDRERRRAAAARDEATARADERDRALASLEAERDELLARVRRVERAGADDARADDADAERRQLAMELEAARGKLAELDHLREEHDDLRDAASERDRLRARVAELEGEVASLRARGFAETEQPPAPRGPRGARGTGRALESLLQPLVGSTGMRAAVIADDLGLPVVGFGDHASALAAFSGVADDLASKVASFLPMSRIRRIEVEGEGGTTLCACPHPTTPGFALATLSVGSAPAPEIRRVLERSAAILA